MPLALLQHPCAFFYSKNNTLLLLLYHWLTCRCLSQEQGAKEGESGCFLTTLYERSHSDCIFLGHSFHISLAVKQSSAFLSLVVRHKMLSTF